MFITKDPSTKKLSDIPHNIPFTHPAYFAETLLMQVTNPEGYTALHIDEILEVLAICLASGETYILKLSSMCVAYPEATIKY